MLGQWRSKMSPRPHRSSPMAASSRPLSTLTITFGLVTIPVHLYSASISASRISFNLLHAKDGSRLKQQYVCALDGKIVPREEMVKGYEYAKDQYVIFKPEEIKALEEAGSDAIDIQQFVPLESVDPVYYDKTYLLAPDKHGDKPYALLIAALKDSGQCAVGRWAARGREHVVVIRPTGEGLSMHQLYFKDEVRTIRELGLKDPPQITAAELKLARMLIEQLAQKRFDPNEYRDEFRERVEAAIDKKVKSGKEISSIEAPAKRVAGSGNVVDLMEILKSSLAQKGGSATKAGARKPPKRVTSTVETKTTRRSTRG
jgi:DNA end-binding protein Ku